MRKNLNSFRICGRIHSFGENGKKMLEKKVSGEKSKNPGTEYISGIINVATDEAGLNVVPVAFTYVTGTYGSSGKVNNNFATLANIIENGKTWVDAGKDGATKVQIDGALDLNEFYVDENGTERLVSTKVNSGSFISIVNELPEEAERATFKVDMLINNVTHVDANEERNLPEKTIVKGAIFDFRKNLLPVEFSATNPNAMNYFESLGATNKEPVFTNVWGRQVSEVVVRKLVTESAFGEDEVREVKNTRRDFVITGASKEPYVWDDESSLTAVELNEMIQKREVDLAAMKQRQNDYRASRNAAPAAAAPAKAEFNF
jgi:hypothetical protein